MNLKEFKRLHNVKTKQMGSVWVAWTDYDGKFGEGKTEVESVRAISKLKQITCEL